MSTLYVGNLDHDTTAGDLRREFDRYGRIADVWIARKPPGFAFVEFEDHRDAQDAARDMDGRYILDRRIRVEISRRGGARGDRDERGDRGTIARGPPTRTAHRVKISGLPENASWKELKEMLRKDTEPVYVDLRGRGTAVAEFAQAGDVQIAIERYDDTKLMGAYIRIEKDETDGNERSDSWQRVDRPPRRDRGGRDRGRYRSRSNSRGRNRRDRSRSRDHDRRRRSPSPETRRPRRDSEDNGRHRPPPASPERKPRRRDDSRSPERRSVSASPQK